MGSGASRQKSPEAQAQALNTKVFTMRHLAGLGKNKESKSRTEMQDFLNKKKEERVALEKALDREAEQDRNILMYKAGALAAEMKAKEDEDKENEIYKVHELKETSSCCDLCGTSSMYKVDGFECRVCGKVFHKACLEKRLSPSEVKMVDRAFTNIGWSCITCDNIFELLSPDEAARTSETFEEFDIDKSGDVSLDEFLQFQKKLLRREEHRDMTPDEEEFERFQFKQLDVDGNGSVDYWEFIKNEAAKRLALKPKQELVMMLTDREKKAAKMVFDLLDVNKDGKIDILETKAAFRNWYKFAAEKLPNASNPTIATHVVQGTNLQNTSDADENNDSFINWREFLRGQAIYILSSRPNKVQLS